LRFWRFLGVRLRCFYRLQIKYPCGFSADFANSIGAE